MFNSNKIVEAQKYCFLMKYLCWDFVNMIEDKLQLL